MRGPKVAVVLVSVFNILNTIDCRVGGIFLKDAGITWTVSDSRSGQERKFTFTCRSMWSGLNTQLSNTFVFHVLLCSSSAIKRKTGM